MIAMVMSRYGYAAPASSYSSATTGSGYASPSSGYAAPAAAGYSARSTYGDDEDEVSLQWWSNLTMP